MSISFTFSTNKNPELRWINSSIHVSHGPKPPNIHFIDDQLFEFQEAKVSALFTIYRMQRQGMVLWEIYEKERVKRESAA
jgi:hypothetical protein